MLDAGALPSEAVSSHLAAMDLHLTPFIDGVSTRRGSFMAGLQHGVPGVTTLGVHSDQVLRRASGTAFVASPAGDAASFAAQSVALAADPALREAMRPAARKLYDEEFAFDRASSRLMAMLEEVDSRQTR
jgi:glycosyltransferase involved in cell wall biosynthesis